MIFPFSRNGPANYKFSLFSKLPANYPKNSEKIQSAKFDFQEVLNSKVSSKNLFNLMQMPKNKPLEFSKAFTRNNHGKEFPYRFIETDIYGTRSTTSIIVDKDNFAEIEETSFSKEHKEVVSKKFKLKIK